MDDAGRLLRGILDDPKDESLRLVFADWLEEQGDEPNRVRAELVRLQVERGRLAEGPSRDALDQRARAIVKQHRPLLGPLKPLVRWHGPRAAMPLLTVASMPAFLGASLADAEDGPLYAGSIWEGQLLQQPHEIPTTLRLLRRRHNHVEGELREDFTRMYGWDVQATFLFRGVVIGRDRLLFVTYTVRNAGVWPGLYELRLSRAGLLTGPWRVPSYSLDGQMQLRRRPDVA